MDIRAALASNLEEIIKFRREFHAHPSPSGSEQPACEMISAALKRHGIRHHLLLDGTAICAFVGTGSEPCVGIRADIDALPIVEESGLEFASKNPGYMHACGHDIHTAVAFGAAMVLKQFEEEIPGTVKIFFQPAEETKGGAERMIASGVLDTPKVKNVIGLHVAPGYEAGKAAFRYGKMYAASDEFTLRIYGKSCHGAYPERGTDATLMASRIILALQEITSDNSDPYEAGVISVGKVLSGTAGNIISGYAELTGIMRSLTEERRLELRKAVKEKAEEIARASGGSSELEVRASYTALINDDEVVSVVEETAKEVFGEGNVIIENTPQMTTEDFSYFAKAVPSCYYHLGCGFKDRKNAPIHSEKFNADEACIAPAIELQVKGALKLLKGK